MLLLEYIKVKFLIMWDLDFFPLVVDQVLERSSAQEIHDEDLVEEISSVQHHSADEGSSQRAAEPDVLSRTTTGSLRSKCPVLPQ